MSPSPYLSTTHSSSDNNIRRSMGRTRASSFNHQSIRRQQSDLVLPIRRPSYDSHARTQHKPSTTYLSVQTNITHQTGASSVEDSGSEDENSLYQSLLSNYGAVDTVTESPTPMTHEDKSLQHSHSQRNKKKSVFNNTKGSKSTSSSTSTHQLYDDGSSPVYPPPQKQSKQRDQYGFIKSSQWITEDDFNQFESNYAPTVKRRLLKWRHLIVENGNRLPPRSSKVKRYIRKGIPAEYRGQAWLYYSGADRMMEANKGLYVDLVQKAEEMGADNENMDIIERDLHRTFPENDRFRPDSSCPAPEDKIRVPIIKSLRRLLLAFSLYAPSIGYCQSLNYIAGMLLLFMNEEEAFWVFVKTITKILPPNVYDVTMEGANIDQNVLMILIYERFPHIWNKISGGKSFWECEEDGTGMPTCSLVTSHWFLTLFINILPVESVLRVWDCLFYDGQKVLFRVALGIFKLNESDILSVNDPLEVFQIIQNMPKRMIDCHKLIDGTYYQYATSTLVSDEEIRDRRELFRKRRDERRRNIPVEKGGIALKRGTMRGVIIHRAKEARWLVERAKSVRK